MRCDLWSCVFFFVTHRFFLDLMCFLGQMMTDTLHHLPLDDSWIVFFFWGGESPTWQTAAAGMIPYIMGT